MNKRQRNKWRKRLKQIDMTQALELFLELQMGLLKQSDQIMRGLTKLSS